MRYFIYYSTQLASSFPPGRNLPVGNDLYHSCTSFEGVGSGGELEKKCEMPDGYSMNAIHIYVHVYVCVDTFRDFCRWMYYGKQ